MRVYRVKCVDTGEYSTSDKAYKGQNGKYYSSKEAYDKTKEEASYRFQSIDYLSFLLGYDKDIPAPTFLYKKLEEMKKCGYKVIYKTIEQHEDDIKWALENKEFKNETAKISYIMAILRNNVIDVYKEEKAQEKTKVVQIKDYIKPDNNMDVDYRNLRGAKGKGRDVSRFLGDVE